MRLGIGFVLMINDLDAFDGVAEDEIMVDRSVGGFDGGIGCSDSCFPVALSASELCLLAHVSRWGVR